MDEESAFSHGSVALTLVCFFFFFKKKSLIFLKKEFVFSPVLGFFMSKRFWSCQSNKFGFFFQRRFVFPMCLGVFLDFFFFNKSFFFFPNWLFS